MEDSSKPKRRWYRFTPDRFILGLLAVEGFLLLSERFRWFAFNEKRGFTLLVALAAVCLGVLFLLLWFAASLLLRRRFQFGLRSLVVLVLIVAIPCSWLAVWLERKRPEHRAVNALSQLGAEVTLKDEESAPAWLKTLLGDGFFAKATSVSLRNNDVTDADLKPLRELRSLDRLVLSCHRISDAGLDHIRESTQLRSLHLHDMPRITDAGMKHLRGLVKLERIYLAHRNYAVTDASLAELSKLPNLKDLHLDGAQITDAGLVHLQGLSNLEWISLRKTRITDEGLGHFSQMKNLRVLSLDDTKITDDNLGDLEGLNLRSLNIQRTLVTKAGVERLKKALPGCRIRSTPITDVGPDALKGQRRIWRGRARITGDVLAQLKGDTTIQRLDLSRSTITDTDLEYLAGLSGLEYLSLGRTFVTDAGLVHLRGLRGLRDLWLSDTQISDDGLAHLRGLTELQTLTLDRTAVTDEGLEYIEDLSNLRFLGIGGTQVSDDGLLQLEDLGRLRALFLHDNPLVTEEGVERLRTLLPNCRIEYHEH
jgi:Leucine-rich repeat (LRR) protein